LGVLRGRKGNVKEGRGREGKVKEGKGMKSFPLFGLCDNFTILSFFFFIKSIHCVILFYPF
jgi:hypothetical protein